MDRLQKLTIVGGKDKFGNKEAVEITIKQGDIICIVGPTGSGKSRLLGDIECLAHGDTPTGRRILINDKEPDRAMRLSYKNKLVAQLSQNMNFIMDISAEKFIRIHAHARNLSEENSIDQLVEMVISHANKLSGERFSPDTPVTQLSGGQSRALMIADTALLSPAPIVLIDEIENAGIDRNEALDLLVKKEKIVLMSTHDPMLALIGAKRLVMKNGKIESILETTDNEKANLIELDYIYTKLINLRNSVRNGECIDFDVRKYFSWSEFGN